jgi:HPt (histidine-containing phosphotransfer) domain-containing protein
MAIDPQGHAPPQEQAHEVLDPQLLENLRALQDPGEPDLALELITLFLRDTDSRLTRLRAAITAGDRPAIAELAHQLKGSAGALSAGRLGETASSLEQSVRHGNPDAAALRDLFGNVCSAFADVRDALDQLGFR